MLKLFADYSRASTLVFMTAAISLLWVTGCGGNNNSSNSSNSSNSNNSNNNNSGDSNSTYTLSLAESGNGSGTVNSADGKISCPSACSATYTAGTSVTLSAASRSGSSFDGWTGSCSGEASNCSIIMNENNSVSASFIFTATTVSLNVGIANGPEESGGTVISTDGRIDCPGVCSATYSIGSSVTLTASGSGFSGFEVNGSGNRCYSGSGDSCTLILNSCAPAGSGFPCSTNVTAEFGP
jgi:hypothetical protein